MSQDYPIIVKSIRGPQGGYLLGKDAKDISVGDILRALEGSLAPTDCTCEVRKHNCRDYCGVDGECCTKSVWEKLRDGINNVVDGISLKELIEDYERQGNTKEINYL